MNDIEPRPNDLAAQFERLTRGSRRGGGNGNGNGDVAFAPRSYRLARRDLPPRKTIIRGRIYVNHITLIAAPGASMKSTISDIYGMSVRTGLSLCGWPVTRPGNVLVFNFEDSDEEREKRHAAIEMFGIPADRGPSSARRELTESDLKHVVYMTSERLAFVGYEEPARSAFVDQEVLDTVTRFCIENDVRLIIADPMLRLHNGDENSNVQMDLLMDALTRMLRAITVGQEQRALDEARQAWVRAYEEEHGGETVPEPRPEDLTPRPVGCGMLLVHHTRKGGSDGGPSANAARGAAAIVNASRLALSLERMTAAEAKLLGIDPDNRRDYIGESAVKANFSSVDDKAWYRVHLVPMDNADGVEDEDTIVVMERVFLVARNGSAAGGVDLTMEQVRAGLELIKAGIDGEPWTDNAKAKHRTLDVSVSVIDPLAETLSIIPHQAKQVLAEWHKRGWIARDVLSFKGRGRKPRDALRVKDEALQQAREGTLNLKPARGGARPDPDGVDGDDIPF